MERKPAKKYLSKEDALAKLQRYCAYQERCHREVRSKLLDLGIYGDDLEEIIANLIQDNFLNEERYARSFARGKFRMKQWGRNRIRQQLKMRDVPDYCIRKAMEEITEKEYLTIVQQGLKKRASPITEENDFIKKNKLAQYATSRGFEAELVWEALKENG